MFLFSSRMGRVSWWSSIFVHDHKILWSETAILLYMIPLVSLKQSATKTGPPFSKTDIFGRDFGRKIFVKRCHDYPVTQRVVFWQDLDEAELGGNLSWFEPSNHFGRLLSYRPSDAFCFLSQVDVIEMTSSKYSHHQGVLDICFVFGNLTSLKDGPWNSGPGKPALVTFLSSWCSTLSYLWGSTPPK